MRIFHGNARLPQGKPQLVTNHFWQYNGETMWIYNGGWDDFVGATENHGCPPKICETLGSNQQKRRWNRDMVGYFVGEQYYDIGSVRVR